MGVKKEVKKEAKKESKQVVDKAEKEVSQITTKVEEEKMKTKKVQAKEHVEEEDAVKQIDKVQQLQHKLDTASKVAKKKDDSSKKIKQLHLRLAESLKQTESIKSQLSNATAATSQKAEEVKEKEEEIEQTKQDESKKYTKLQTRAHKISLGAINCAKAVQDLKIKLKSANDAAATAKNETESSLATCNAEKIDWKKKYDAEIKEQGGRIEKIKGLESEVGQLKEKIAKLDNSGKELAMGMRLRADETDDAKEKLESAESEKAKIESKMEEVKKKADMLDTCQQNIRIAATKCNHRVDDQAKKLNGLVAKAQSQAAISNRAYEMCKSELAASKSEDASMKAVAVKSEVAAAETAADAKSKIAAEKAKVKKEEAKKGDKKKSSS